MDDRLDYEAAKYFTAANVELERTLFYGKRVVNTSSVPSAMGGLETFITDNTDTTSEALTEKKINDLLDETFQDVGHDNGPSLIVVQSWQKRKISDLYAPYGRQETSSTKLAFLLTRSERILVILMFCLRLTFQRIGYTC